VWYRRRKGARTNRSVSSRLYVFLGIPRRSSCSMSEKDGIYALFVSRKPNSRNSFSSFSNVWQPSGNLVKGKLIPVNKKNLLYLQESVFLSLSKGKHFPIFTDKTHLNPSLHLCPKTIEKQKDLRITLFISGIFPSNFSIIFLYYFLYVFIFFIFFRSARIIVKNP